MSADVAIYGTVGGLLIVAVLILVIIFVLKKCKERREANRASILDKETMSIQSVSASSKDQLLYGSRGKTGPFSTTDVVSQPMSKVAPVVTSYPQPSLPMDSSGDDHRSSCGSFSSSARESSIDRSMDPVDSATRFLQRRHSQENIDLKNVGTIQPDLYMRKGSIVTSHTAGKAEIVGQILLRLQYDFSKSDFVVSILETKDLFSSTSDCFFTVSLDPEIDSKTRQSALRKKSQKGPAKAEDFKFPLTYEELMDRRLILKFFEQGKLGRIPQIAGELLLELAEFDPSAGVEVWADVEARKKSDIYGELLFSLTYLPSAQRLTVTLHKAKDLKKMDLSGGSDPYVKVFIVQEGKVVKKRRSSVRKHTLSPVWNEALNFNLPEKALKKSHLEMIVMDHDLIGNDEPLGKIVLGPACSDPRAKHVWEDLMQTKSAPPTWLTLHFCASSDRRNSND